MPDKNPFDIDLKDTKSESTNPFDIDVPLKKKDGGKESVSTTTPKMDMSFLESGGKTSLIRGDIAGYKGVPRQTANEPERITQLEAAKKEFKEKSLTNTAQRRLSAKGIKPTDGNIQLEKESLKKDLDNGSVDFVIDDKGQPALGRVPKFHEAAVKGFFDVVSNISDDIDLMVAKRKGKKELNEAFKNIENRKELENNLSGNVWNMMNVIDPTKMSAAIVVDAIRAQKEGLPRAEPSTIGKIGEMAGQVVPYILTTELGIVPMATMATMQALPEKATELYSKYKKQGLSEEDAAEKATDNAPFQGFPTALMNLLLMKGGGESEASKNLSQALYGLLKSSTKMGIKGAGAEAGTIAAEAIQGDKPTDIWNRLTNAYGNWFKMDFTQRGLMESFNLPKYIRSAVKENAIQPEINLFIQQAIKETPNSNNIVNDLNKYQIAREKVAKYTPTDIMHHVSGLQEAIDNGTAKLEEIRKDKTISPEIVSQEETALQENIRKQSEMLKTGRGNDYEVDEVTGQKAGEELSISRHSEIPREAYGTENEVITPKGESDAAQVGESLPKGTNVVTSDMPRSIQTGEIIAEKTEGKLEQDPLIRERGENESPKDLAKRVQEIKDKYENRRDTHIVTHGEVMTMMDAVDKAGGDLDKAVQIFNSEESKSFDNNEVYQKPEVLKEEIVPKEEKTFAQKDLDRAEAKKIHAKVKDMEVPTSAEQIALRYIAEDGKIGKSVIDEIAGSVKRATLNTGEREKLSQAVKSKGFYSPKEERSLSKIAHDLWEKSGQEVSEIDIKDALMDAINSHNTRLEAGKSYLEQYSPEYAEEQYYNKLAEERKAEFEAEQDELENQLRSPLDEQIEGEASEEHLNNLIQQYEAEYEAENKQSSKGGEGEVTKEIGGGTSGEEDEEGSGVKPPKPPKEKPQEPMNFGSWTRINIASLGEVKESFRRVGISWDARKESAMEDLADKAKLTGKTLFETAKSRMDDLFKGFSGKFAGLVKTAPKFNIDDQIQLHFLKLATEQSISKIADLLDKDVDNTFLLSERDRLLNTLDQTASVLQAMRSESGVGLAYGTVEAMLSPENGLQVRRMQMMNNLGVNELTPELQKFTSDTWQKEKELLEKENNLKEQKLKEDFENTIKDLQNQLKKKSETEKPKTGIFKESGENLAAKLRILGEKAKKSDFGKAKGIEGAQIQGVSVDFNKFAGEALIKIADAVEKGADLLDAISEYVKETFKGQEAKSFQRDLIRFLEGQGSREDALSKIKGIASEKGVDYIHPDMVTKNMIKDYVNSYIGEVPVKEVLTSATEGLKEVFPNISEDELRSAYLKKGAFEQPTKAKAKSILTQTKETLNSISKLEQDISDLEKGINIISKGKGSEKEFSDYEKELIEKKKELILKNKEGEYDEKIKQLKETGELLKSIKNKKPSEINERLLLKKEELDKVKNSLGIKNSSISKEEKSKIVERGNSHNQRLDKLKNSVNEVGDKLPKLKEFTDKLNEDINKSIAKVSEQSELNQDQILNESKKKLVNIQSELERKISKTIVGSEKKLLQKLNSEIQGVLDGFNRDQSDSIQDIKLKNAKNELASQIKELTRKINAGEFEEAPVAPKLTKTDSELINLEKDKKTIESEYYKKYKEERLKNGKNIDTALQFARGLNVFWLIKSPSTMINVGWSGISRPFAERATKITFLPILSKIAPAISERAKAGGEGVSELSLKAGLKAQFRGISIDKLEKENERLANNAKSSEATYLAQKDLVESLSKNSSEYKKQSKILDKLKNEHSKNVLKQMSNVVFDFIGSSSYADAYKTFLYRNAQIEQMFGDFGKELPQSVTKMIDEEGNKTIKWFTEEDTKSTKFKKIIEDLNYMVGFVGRAHSAAKGFSGRSAFAESFVSKLEYAFTHDEDITSFDKYMEIAHEAYLDWDRGKYQNKNFITDAWNGVMGHLAYKYKGTDWEVYAKALTTTSSLEVAITRVPVNMLHEFIAEYTLGALRTALPFGKASIPKVMREAKAKIEAQGFTKGVKVEEGITYGTTEKEYSEALYKEVQKLPKEQAAMIARCFRKGGFGLGLYALSAFGVSLGIWKFGGMPHKGQTAEDKKKEEGELKTGEVSVLDKKIPEWAAKALEHTNIINPSLFGESMRLKYAQGIREGKSKMEALNGMVMQHLKVLESKIPQTAMFSPTGAVSKISDKFVKSRAKIEEEGGEIDVHAIDTMDDIRILIGMFGGKEKVLTEDNYKLASGVMTTYRKALSLLRMDTTLSKSELEKQEKELYDERDKELEEIRKENESYIQERKKELQEKPKK